MFLNQAVLFLIAVIERFRDITSGRPNYLVFRENLKFYNLIIKIIFTFSKHCNEKNAGLEASKNKNRKFSFKVKKCHFNQFSLTLFFYFLSSIKLTMLKKQKLT